MAQGLTGDLLLAAFSIWLFGIWILSRDLPRAFVVPVVTFKVALPLFYFAYLFDGIWTLKDDWYYYYVGATLLRAGYHPLTIFFSRDGIYQMAVLASGSHFLYYWYNLLAQYLFGMYYYAPVFLNVGLTCVAGTFLYRICRIAGFKKSYAQGLLLFFLLHWDILAWSSLLNLKDILVMTLMVIAHYYLIRLLFVSEHLLVKCLNLGFLFAVLFALLFIRPYRPVLVAATAGVWAMYKMRGLNVKTQTRIPSRFTEAIRIEPDIIASGFVHFVLTPQPWSIALTYSFLLLPSILHWLMVVPALIGGYSLWKRSPVGALLLIFLLITTCFYSIMIELQGPRHRLQLTFIIAWMQYHFLYLLYQTLMKIIQPAHTTYAAKPTT
jgi:hypothetical protein